MLLLLSHEFVEAIYFVPAKSATMLKPHRFKPEFCSVVVTLHVNVRWLVTVTSIE